MTRDEILNMEAGREMDALVAEKVMGIPKPIYVHPPELHQEFGRTIKVQGWYCQPNYAGGDKCEWYPNPYSTDIGAAWEVYEFATFKHFQIDRTDDRGTRYYASCATPFIAKTAWADTAPLAVCRAALLAVMEG